MTNARSSGIRRSRPRSAPPGGCKTRPRGRGSRTFAATGAPRPQPGDRGTKINAAEEHSAGGLRDRRGSLEVKPDRIGGTPAVGDPRLGPRVLRFEEEDP